MVELHYKIALLFLYESEGKFLIHTTWLKDQLRVESFRLGGLILQQEISAGRMELLVSLKPTVPVSRFIRNLKRTLSSGGGQTPRLLWKSGFSCISVSPDSIPAILT